MLPKTYLDIGYFDLLTQSMPLNNLPVITTDPEVLIAKFIYLNL